MLETVIKSAVDLTIAFLKNRAASGTNLEAAAAQNLEQHLTEALHWSQRFQFYGMSRSRDTSAATIALHINSEPRRFKSTRSMAATKSELDLLGDTRNYILLGGPGAGKTTTLKRITLRLLTEEPSDGEVPYDCPVAIRLRELPEPVSLLAAIATAIGLPPSISSSEPPELMVGALRLDQALAEYFTMHAIIVLVDGLDELTSSHRQAAQRDLTWLARHAGQSKLIVSCRTGDYTALIEGLDIVEICPLTGTQIDAIARCWLDDVTEFMVSLNSMPYRDVGDRPLLLAQLLMLFQRYGFLPEQPSQIYRRVVNLLLTEWDAERSITRRSKYAGFNPDRKLAFLAALSYHLTYRVRQKMFSSDDLLRAYAAVREQFALPRDEAAQVVSELETHTGIIAVAGAFTFEFEHLSLQEYLCAEYLVRDPFADHLGAYLAEYPSPVAVAVALASNPSAWFAALMLRTNTHGLRAALRSFVSRLILEKPQFTIAETLGFALIKLYGETINHDEDLRQPLDGLLPLPNVLPSVDAALRYFECDKAKLHNDYVRLRRRSVLLNEHGLPTPESGVLPRIAVEWLAQAGSARAREMLSKT